MRHGFLLSSVCVALTLTAVGVVSLRAPAQMASGKLSVAFPVAVIDFKPGPNLGVAQANCLVCHGADYVYNQPALTKAQWTAEVNKMRNAYKATIADADVEKIVDYLMSQNGKS